MAFNENQAQEPKSAVEAAKDKGKEALKAWEGISQNLIDKAYEMQAFVKGETTKEAVVKNSGKPEYASIAAKEVRESHDASTLKEYMRYMNPDQASKVTPEAQLALLEAANSTFGSHSELSNPVDGFRNFDDSSKLYEAVAKLPEAQKKMVQEYRDAYARGEYQDSMPASVRGFPEDVQREMYKNRPKIFARSFPDSKIVEGKVLQDLVEQAVHELNGTSALQLKYTQIGRENSLLKNPNLSKEQKKDLAVAFLSIKFGEERNDNDYFSSLESAVKMSKLIKSTGVLRDDAALTKKFEETFGWAKDVTDTHKKKESEEAATREYWAKGEKS